MKRKALRRVSGRQKVIEGLLGLWREIVLAIHGYRCAAAGRGGIRCGGPIQAHHIYPQGGYRFMRFMVENGIPLCRNHHIFWLHQRASAFEVASWMTEVLDPKTLRLLDYRSMARRSFKKVDLEAERLLLEKERERIWGCLKT